MAATEGTSQNVFLKGGETGKEGERERERASERGRERGRTDKVSGLG